MATWGNLLLCAPTDAHTEDCVARVHVLQLFSSSSSRIFLASSASNMALLVVVLWWRRVPPEDQEHEEEEETAIHHVQVWRARSVSREHHVTKPPCSASRDTRVFGAISKLGWMEKKTMDAATVSCLLVLGTFCCLKSSLLPPNY